MEVLVEAGMKGWVWQEGLETWIVTKGGDKLEDEGKVLLAEWFIGLCKIEEVVWLRLFQSDMIRPLFKDSYRENGWEEWK
jgi:hypothetical protein